MVIGICDDDRYWLEKAGTVIRTYGKTHHLDFDVYVFENSDELFEDTGWVPDILFLDIVWEGSKQEDGIALAKRVNQKWKKCQIVFLTNYLYYAMDVYETAHVFFVVKEQFEERLETIFEKTLHALSQVTKRLTFSVAGKSEVTLLPEDIYYFERDLRVTKIVTAHGTYVTGERMGSLQKRLPELDFVRCHNSYIVYLPYVLEMGKDNFVLRSGEKIIISRGYQKKVREIFLSWARMQR